jgi:hypothetical protein
MGHSAQLPAYDRAMRRLEEGQATVEWSALVLLVAVLFAGLGYAVARTQAWGLGGDVLHALVCAVRGGCDDGREALEAAYGKKTAELVRRYSPNLTYERDSREVPIDFRRCRKAECSNGSDVPARIDRSSAGLPVTAFTRVVDRRPSGGSLFVQYWFYYPESFTGGIGRVFGHRWPGYHADDWEGVQLMFPDRGPVLARATAHGGYGGGWVRWKGWYRVSGGSHAGDVVDSSSGERTTSASELTLTPLERMSSLGAQSFEITPPWLKAVYRNPESEYS